MFSCTSTWALCHGRDSRLPPSGRSMNVSVRRKCPPLLRCCAKVTHVSSCYSGVLECSKEVFAVFLSDCSSDFALNLLSPVFPS